MSTRRIPKPRAGSRPATRCVCSTWCNRYDDASRIWCPTCNLWWSAHDRALDAFGVRA